MIWIVFVVKQAVIVEWMLEVLISRGDVWKIFLLLQLLDVEGPLCIIGSNMYEWSSRIVYPVGSHTYYCLCKKKQKKNRIAFGMNMQSIRM